MSAVGSFYTSVVNEVIENLKIQFNEEGIDPAALNDLKELWEKKIKESGALDAIKNSVPQASQFSNLMQQNGLQGNVANRINSTNNPGSRLIKPSSQGSVMPDQGFATARMTLPVYQVQTGNAFRGNTMVPVVINQNQPQGVAFLSQYHNIIPHQNSSNHIIQDNGIVNLRKNQTDGIDDNSSDEDAGDDFVNVSEVDPHSVRPPMSNLTLTPSFKRELKQDESDDDYGDHEIDVLNSSSINPIKNEDSEEEEDDDNDDDAEDNANEEAPLNSEDDISDDDPHKIFETENVMVCQYEKVSRTRNKWKFNFVHGIANLYGKDTVFHKAVGEAEW